MKKMKFDFVPLDKMRPATVVMPDAQGAALVKRVYSAMTKPQRELCWKRSKDKQSLHAGPWVITYNETAGQCSLTCGARVVYTTYSGIFGVAECKSEASKMTQLLRDAKFQWKKSKRK